MAKPNKCISVTEAKMLQENWVNSRATAITNSRSGEEDCREFVYSVAEMQEFLDYIKDGSAKEGIANPGIRIYFGAYNGEKDNRATIFISGTNGAETTSENNYNLDPLNMNQGGWPPKGY